MDTITVIHDRAPEESPARTLERFDISATSPLQKAPCVYTVGRRVAEVYRLDAQGGTCTLVLPEKSTTAYCMPNDSEPLSQVMKAVCRRAAEPGNTPQPADPNSDHQRRVDLAAKLDAALYPDTQPQCHAFGPWVACSHDDQIYVAPSGDHFNLHVVAEITLEGDPNDPDLHAQAADELAASDVMVALDALGGCSQGPGTGGPVSPDGAWESEVVAWDWLTFDELVDVLSEVVQLDLRL